MEPIKDNVIYVTDESSKLLSQLVDMALKAQGLNALNLVNQLVLKHIKDYHIDSTPTIAKADIAE